LAVLKVKKYTFIISVDFLFESKRIQRCGLKRWYRRDRERN